MKVVIHVHYVPREESANHSSDPNCVCSPRTVPFGEQIPGVKGWVKERLVFLHNEMVVIDLTDDESDDLLFAVTEFVEIVG